MRHALLALFIAATARASSLSDELSVGLVQSNPADPHGTTLTDQLRAQFDIGDQWDLLVGAGFTHAWATPPPTGGHYGTSSANVGSITAGPTWDVTPRLDLYGTASWSPSARQTYDQTIRVRNPRPPPASNRASLLVDGTTGLYGVTLGAGYIFGGSEVEGFVLGGLALDLSVGWTGYVIEQKVSDVFVTGGQLTAAEVLRQCRAGEIPAATCNRLRPAIKGAQDTLNQLRLGLYGTQTLGETTDLDLGLSYDLYDQDPAIAGAFTSRAGVLLFQSSAASGLPLAPERLAARAGINQTLGPVELSPWYQYTLYASDEGWQHAAGLKVRVKLGRDWRVWATGVAFFDALTTTTGSSASTVHVSLVSGTVALGVRARF